MSDWTSRAEALAGELAAEGSIRDPAWHEAFAATPRHVFVPRFYELDEYHQPRTPRYAGEAAHVEAVYQNRVLVTRYRAAGTMPDGQEVRVADSSASLPSVVATMLDRLAVDDACRVLEIGTGTGYHAALLAARLGDDRVTSIEVDPHTSAEAAGHLRAAGWNPTLVAGDGAAGCPERAPFDRIIATCAVDHVPSAWIDQLAAHGLLVAPMTYCGALAVLKKTAEGEVSGRLDPQRVYFMSLRSPAATPIPESHSTTPAPVYRTTTDVPPMAWRDQDFVLWRQWHQPEARAAERVDTQGSLAGIVVSTAGHSATVDYDDDSGATWPVTQDAGRLWNTVEAAWAAWQRHGEPDRTRIGITARTDGQQVACGQQVAWLDDPDGPLRWPLQADA